MTKLIDKLKKHPVVLVLGSSLFTAVFSILGSQYFTEKNQTREIQVAYFEGLKSLDLEFRRYMAELTSDNSPPLDAELIKKMTDNLLAQDVQVDMLIASLKPSEAKVFDDYRVSLFDTRTVLLASQDPGDIHDIAEQVGTLVDKQTEMAEVILQ